MTKVKVYDYDNLSIKIKMNKLSSFSKKLSKGFTLIELLIVIAVIGVLAAVILVAIDPIEQLARGRDAGRKSTNVQLGRALEAFYANTGSYPDPAAGPLFFHRYHE